MRKWSIEKKILAGFAAAILILASVGGLAFYNTSRLVESDHWVTHTHEVLSELASTLSTMQDAETSQRGYLLTGEDHYLAPYNAAPTRINAHIARLRVLTQDNPAEQLRIATLETRINSRLDTLRQTLKLRREGGPEAVPVSMFDLGQRQMDDVRALVADMQKEENALLTARNAQVEAGLTNTETSFAVCVALLTLLLGLGYLLIKIDLGERRRTEAALMESEERFRRLSGATREGVALHENGKIIEANQALADMFGYSLEELIGKDAFALTTPISQEIAAEKVRAGLEEPYEIYGLRKDRSFFPMEVCARSIPYEGRMARVSTVRDLTERKRAEEALRQSEEEYRGLFENAFDAILVLSPQTEEVLDANRAACILYGYAHEDFVGVSMRAISHDPDRVEAPDGRLLAQGGQGGTVQFETRQYRRDGKPLDLEITASIVDYKGKRAYLSINRDVTERKRAEAAIRASEQKYRLLMDQASDGVTVMDRAGNYIEANTRACEGLGYTREEILALNACQVVAPEDLARRSLLEDRRDVKKGLLIERILVRKDGTRFPVEISGRLLEDGAIQAIVRDVTERKRAEEALQLLATRDPLTGLLNRGEMDRVLAQEVARCRRYKRPLSVIMVDIDHFKQVNDRYGHNVGDEVLRGIGAMFRDHVRNVDYAARYGGEELALILPETTDADALVLAERFRCRVEERPFTYVSPDGAIRQIPLTISLGVAELPSNAATPDALLIAADQALYRAKRAGRNRVVSYDVYRNTTTEQLVAI